MLDKSLKYYDVLMKRECGKPYVKYSLPNGYRFKLFEPGDEKYWAEIEASVLEFNSPIDALIYFQRDYLPYINELKRRCLFIETSNGRKVATLTIWWNYTGVRRDPWIHWVAVHRDYQGLGLGKALVAEGVKRLLAIEVDRDVYLHTQTWSYKAIGIYKKAGFEITQEKGLSGYENNDYEKAIEEMAGFLK